MRKIVNQYVTKFLKDHRRKKYAICLFMALALLVTFTVSWQLKLNGEAMINNTAESDADNGASAEPAAQAEDFALTVNPLDTLIDKGVIEGTEVSWMVTEDDLGVRTLTVGGKGEIPNYSTSNLPPWSDYGSSGSLAVNLVVEDGITRIGEWAFGRRALASVELGADVQSIGKSAFAYTTFNENVNIPGTVKTIESSAFQYATLNCYTIGEGVEFIGDYAFSVQTNGKEPFSVHLPASLKHIEGTSLGLADYITVADANLNYVEENGILYSKDMTELVCFPKFMYMKEYRVPGSVTTIQKDALCQVQKVEKLRIPATVNKVVGNLASSTKCREIYFENGFKFPANGGVLWFAASTELNSLRLPEDTDLTLKNLFNAGKFDKLNSFTFPNKTLSINNLFANKTDSLAGLETVRYDAESAQIIGDTIMGPNAYFDLTIGAHVDILPKEFAYFVQHATGFSFEPDNWFTAAEGVFDSAPAPLNRLSGATVYVDGQGVVYICDNTDNTATVIYCPADIANITIPETIVNGEKLSYTVNSVGKDALKSANSLTTIAFAKTDNIVTLEPFALANCPTLTSVNGKNAYKEVLATFSGATTIGYNVLYNTGIKNAPGSGSFETNMNGYENLTVSRGSASPMNITVGSGSTIMWKPSDIGSDVGGYELLTGETIKLTVSVGNLSATNSVYRVYVRVTDETCSTSVNPGEEYNFDSQTVKCCSTEDPNTIYLEFVPTAGNTVSIPITAAYPTPNTSGGGLVVWGVILENTEAEEHEEKIVESASDTIQAYWTTKAELFQISKTSSGGNTINIVGDGRGKVKVGNDFHWLIELTHGQTANTAYGKDYVKSVDYVDTMTLPQGISWKDEVVAAIKNGDITRIANDIYVGDIKVANINTGGGSISWNDVQNTAELHWSRRNPSQVAELGADKITLIIYREAFSVDMESFNAVADKTVKNKVDATVHYHYADDQNLADEATKTFSITSGRISLKKIGSTASYFGEDITYTLDLSNPNATTWNGSYDGSCTLADNLVKFLYISPENMQKMFDEQYGDDLAVVINDACLAPWTETMGIDRTPSWSHSGNSNIGEGGHTLHVTKEGNQYKVEVDDGDVYIKGSVEEALKAAGYAVTNNATYTCNWKLNDADKRFMLNGGENRRFTIYATVKNSFEILSEACGGSYNELVQIRNKAEVKYSNDGIAVSSDIVSADVKRDATIQKAVFKDGERLTGNISAGDGDVLEYRLNFTHYGSGEYNDLPMVDDLYGSQALLVPIEGNSHLNSLSLETVSDGYYVLDHSHSPYKDVVVGVDEGGNKLVADSITVTIATEETEVDIGGETRSYTGFHTQIKWHFPHLDGGSYRKIVSYNAIVKLELAGANTTYAIGNEVWMNDREESRIFALLWGEGSIIDFDKKIVVQRGDKPELDTVDEDDHIVIDAGDKVLYRINLSYTGEDTFVLHGKDLADALPQNYGIFDWERDENVKLVDICYSGQEHPTFTNIESWSIADCYGALLDIDRQYIVWPQDAEIKFTAESSITLYFELTFPDDSEGENAWKRFTAINRGGKVDNTLHVCGNRDSVFHDVKEGGQVLLQKGVYSFGWRDSETSDTYNESGNTRQYYNNRDSKYRSITYYVALYNGGNKRMYLNDLYDKLPTGFTFKKMTPDGKAGNLPGGQFLITTIGGISLEGKPLVEIRDATGEDTIVYRDASIRAYVDGQTVRFSIEAGNGSYPVRYDEERGQYYLDRGDAIVFGYIADIGFAADTEKFAVNAIAMPYTDHLESGVVQLGKEFHVNAPVTDQYFDQNDGRRFTMDSYQTKENYGFPENGEIWLASDVTVRRGDIVPGITKITDSYTTGVGVTLPYTNAVGTQDTVHWKILMHNSGTRAITDYTLTDIMPNPFAFVGTVKLAIYDGNGNLLTSKDILEFPNRSGGEPHLTIVNKYNNNTSVNASFDGDWNDLRYGEISFSLNREEDGNEILNIRFEAPTFSIPEGGYAEVVLSSKNPTNSYKNEVYNNQAILTPNVQSFENVGQGVLVSNENGKPMSVRNYSPAVVSYGFATSSNKSVIELTSSDNIASSNSVNGDNSILLPNLETAFQYTLEISNDTDVALRKLVIIDALPEPGDHSPFDNGALRGSAFKISLAENPALQFMVTKKDGTVTTLTQGSDYTLEYSTETDFGDPGGADWKGESNGTTAAWSDDLAPTSARAFRIIVNDPSGTKFPSNSKIEVKFNAEIDGPAEPSSVAWNSFGYHYLIDFDKEDSYLEAMPLKVGVKTPSVPILRKELLDAGGQPIVAEKDENFSFIIHEGAALEGEYKTEEELYVALNAKCVNYQKFELTVKSGESVSERLKLAPHGWQYEKGKQYTIIETPITRGGYLFYGFNYSDRTAHTFTYDPNKSVNIVCQNQFVSWDVQLTKRDGADDQKSLSGALFGLYSQNAQDRIGSIPEEYCDLNIQSELTVDGHKWYLKNIQTSNGEGRVVWQGLTEPQYYLLEIRPPNGYKLNSQNGQILSREGATDGMYCVTVLNYKGALLPESGGIGSTGYIITGLLLLSGSWLIYRLKKRAKKV